MSHIPTIHVRLPRASGPSHLATLTIDDWTIPCTVGSGGLVQARLKREGDTCTPMGIFPLRYGFYDAVNWPDFPQRLGFPFVPLTDEMIWEDSGEAYNRLVYTDPAQRLEERLVRRRADHLFDIMVPFGFNDAVPEPGRGSALFVHVARSDMRGTEGCVAVPREHLQEFVSRLKPGMMIDIGYADAVSTVVQDNQPANVTPDDPFETVRFAGMEPGRKLIIVGAVHGNEVCGTKAILRVIEDCRAGRIKIRRGKVTFVPVANLKAYRQNTREGDRNLNRDFSEKPIPQNYEDKVANILGPLLREHEVLLDLHSFSSEGEPFIFCGPLDNTGPAEPFRWAAEEGAFAARLGVDIVMHGWLDNYARLLALRAENGFRVGHVAEGVGTTEFMRFSGGYAVTLECGTHKDPEAVNVAYRAILNALAHLGLVDAPAPAVSMTRGVEVVQVVLCMNEGDRLAQPWKTGDAVTAGDVIARRANDEPLLAPSDGMVVFPNASAKPGDGFYYFAAPSSRAF